MTTRITFFAPNPPSPVKMRSLVADIMAEPNTGQWTLVSPRDFLIWESTGSARDVTKAVQKVVDSFNLTHHGQDFLTASVA